jgi:hypothetical protein
MELKLFNGLFNARYFNKPLILLLFLILMFFITFLSLKELNLPMLS